MTIWSESLSVTEKSWFSHLPSWWKVIYGRISASNELPCMSIHQQSNYGTLSAAVNRAYSLSMTINIQSLRWPQWQPFIEKRIHILYNSAKAVYVKHACWQDIFSVPSQTHFSGDYTNKWQCCFCLVVGLSGRTETEALLSIAVAFLNIVLSEEREPDGPECANVFGNHDKRRRKNKHWKAAEVHLVVTYGLRIICPETSGFCACLPAAGWHYIRNLRRGLPCVGKLRPNGSPPSSGASFRTGLLRIQTHWPGADEEQKQYIKTSSIQTYTLLSPFFFPKHITVFWRCTVLAKLFHFTEENQYLLFVKVMLCP